MSKLSDNFIQTVPASLRDVPNWVLWDYETRDGKQTKVPYEARADEKIMAKTNEPASWSDFGDAYGLADEYDGVGIVLTGTPLTGVDLDGLAPNRIVDPFAQSLIEIAGNPYTEFSPSGDGLRFFVGNPKLPKGKRRFTQQDPKFGIEIYTGKEGGRYLTITGDKVPGTGNSVPLISDWDLELLYTISTQVLNAKFRALWTGDRDFIREHYNADDSSADAALVAMLMPLFNRDPQKIEDAFSASALGQREKWINRKDYRDRTIQNALNLPPLTSGIIWQKDGTVNTGVSSEDGIAVDRPKLLTEVGNGRRLIEAYGKNLRYVTDLDSWFVYDKGVWISDRKSKRVQDLLKQVLIGVQIEANQAISNISGLDALKSKLTKTGTVKKGEILNGDETASLKKFISAMDLASWAQASESSSKINGAVEMAKTEPGIGIRKSEFDNNLLLCNFNNGTLVFDRENITATFRPHSREDLCTRKMPVDYNEESDCPKFKEFLNWMFSGDQETVEFLQTYFGLCLTGLVVRAVLILYGEGRNGKSTLVSIISSVLGNRSDNYGASVAFSTFSVGREESAGGTRADLLPLNGPRLITAAESNKAKVRLDMARLKELTGGDQTVARGLYAPEPTSFYCQGKIVLQTNNLPSISDDSEGAWDRIKLLNCNQQVPPDRIIDKFAETLVRDEASGIVNWMKEGVLRYFSRTKQGLTGLKEPSSVLKATEEYRGSENHMARFVTDECKFFEGSKKHRAVSSELYLRYTQWCSANGEEAETQRSLFQFLVRRFKLDTIHTMTGNALCGIELKPQAACVQNGIVRRTEEVTAVSGDSEELPF